VAAPAPATRSAGTARLEARPLALIRQALGGPALLPGKAARLGRVLAAYASGVELDARLERLRRIGLIESIPTRIQLAVGAADMLRFWISPASADYYEQKGISYGFHQVLRFLDEPASLTDPVGFFSTRDGIIGHLMQVVHANPVYDLQLLQMFEDGLDELTAQLRQMLDGTHPRAASIRAIVEEPDYHERLLAFIIAFRRDPTIPPLLRSNVAASDEFSVLERTFGSLTGAMRYFTRLPTSPREAAMHLYTVKEFPAHLA
jgi:hypothetical protein